MCCIHQDIHKGSLVRLTFPFKSISTSLFICFEMKTSNTGETIYKHIDFIIVCFPPPPSPSNHFSLQNKERGVTWLRVESQFFLYIYIEKKAKILEG
ncbi:hypothetical protein XELAEV_18026205mg [Xenopus laevis]|uniref:Uncharacterized protein n=1 Tax=Xenopus laevis TaxID=8355 RepID=A0A974CV89_XENLA|nr:hypothetical protein XELAEV_18026205mg [Xenopus laevis]